MNTIGEGISLKEVSSGWFRLTGRSTSAVNLAPFLARWGSVDDVDVGFEHYRNSQRVAAMEVSNVLFLKAKRNSEAYLGFCMHQYITGCIQRRWPT